MVDRIKDIVPQSSNSHSSKVVVERQGGETQVTLKAQGFKASTMGLIFFAIFWNGFLVVWTTLAASASFLFAAFSIPFWLVGISMILGIFSSLFGHQEIIIRSKELVIRKFVLFLKVERIISYKDLKSIELENAYKYKNRSKNGFKMAVSGSNDNGIASKTPTITLTDDEHFVGEHLSPYDKEWLVDYLNDKIVPLLRYVR